MCRKLVPDMWTIRTSSALIHVPEKGENTLLVSPGAVCVLACFFIDQSPGVPVLSVLQVLLQLLGAPHPEVVRPVV